ncbi:MAG: hypothetical protein EPN82_15330 [Bacteroidetes bacterium]|nr:MAG: hypothetical protein EPN82_15330 [Bacteroidota bacterium]
MLRQKAVKIFIVILGFISFCYISYSQSFVSVPDTIIPRGDVYSITISGKIEHPEVKSVRIRFQYNARVINIKNASGSDNFIMKCNTVKLINSDLNNLEQATIDISCDSISSTLTGVFCILDIEGLAGPDSITKLKPLAVYENEEPDLLALSYDGEIKVPGIPIYQRFPESLSQNFPNPFSGYTIFPISIEKSTKVNFKVYSNNGSEVFISSESWKNSELYKITGSIDIKVNWFEDILEKGNYMFHFIPDAELASGSYFMVMQTDNGIYNIRFLYLK